MIEIRCKFYEESRMWCGIAYMMKVCWDGLETWFKKLGKDRTHIRYQNINIYQS